MRIAVFTGNQPRHNSLVRRLADIADDVWAVQECTTLFPGHRGDMIRQSPVMATYFDRVGEAERRVFGEVAFPPPNVRVLALRRGDISQLGMDVFGEALAVDLCVVFGASFIKGDLCQALLERKALNIHMGVSPFYRGSACNFWALHDGRPDLVGATIHLLTDGIDDGPILFHAVPEPGEADPFDFGMLAVRAAFEGFVRAASAGDLGRWAPVEQDRIRELRYSRGADFTDDVAQAFLDEAPSRKTIGQATRDRNREQFVRLFEGTGASAVLT